MVSRFDLYRHISSAWSRSTSVDPQGWTPANRAWGQCAVTALVVQDALGGELLRASVDGMAHYYNRLPSGLIVDLTRSQFGPNPILGEARVRAREYVLSFPDTSRRYRILRRAAKQLLTDCGANEMAGRRSLMQPGQP